MKIQTLFESPGDHPLDRRYTIPLYAMDHQSTVIVSKHYTRAGETIKALYHIEAPAEAVRVKHGEEVGPFLKRWIEQVVNAVASDLEKETWPAKVSSRVSIGLRGQEVEIVDAHGSRTSTFCTPVTRMVMAQMSQLPQFNQPGWRLERYRGGDEFAFGFLPGRGA